MFPPLHNEEQFKSLREWGHSRTMFLMEAAVLCVEAMQSRYLGCGKSPCGHGVSRSECLKHRDPSERLFSGARIA